MTKVELETELAACRAVLEDHLQMREQRPLWVLHYALSRGMQWNDSMRRHVARADPLHPVVLRAANMVEAMAAVSGFLIELTREHGLQTELLPQVNPRIIYRCSLWKLHDRSVGVLTEVREGRPNPGVDTGKSFKDPLATYWSGNYHVHGSVGGATPNP